MKDAGESTVIKQLAQKQTAAWSANLVGRCSRRASAWFILSAGAILALAGANTQLDALGSAQVWDLKDPLLAVSWRHLMLAVGLAELLLAWLCLFTNKRILSLGLLAWLTMDFLVYRAGLWYMGWPHPWVFIGGLTDALNISPLLADGFVAATSAYLLIGSAAAFWRERDGRAARPRSLAPDLLKMSCPECGGKIQFASQDLGRNIPCPLCKATLILRKPDLLKMSCSYCMEHIEFPAHAIGQKIYCPHCSMGIILKEPP